MMVGTKVKLRGKILADARDDYIWQTDPELAGFDAASPLAISFSWYLSDYANRLHYPSTARYWFAIETLDGKHIGNCTYYNVDETKSEAELGIMIGNRDYWDKGYGADAVSTLVSYIFRHTDLNRIYLKTRDLNTRAQKCFQKCGFIPYGHLVRDGFSFVLMEIRCNQREKQKTKT